MEDSTTCILQRYWMPCLVIHYWMEASLVSTRSQACWQARRIPIQWDLARGHDIITVGLGVWHDIMFIRVAVCCCFLSFCSLPGCEHTASCHEYKLGTAYTQGNCDATLGPSQVVNWKFQFETTNNKINPCDEIFKSETAQEMCGGTGGNSDEISAILHLSILEKCF